MKSRSLILLLMTMLSFSEGQATADAGPQRVEVEGDRVRLVDVLPSAPGAVAQADLGAAPTIHGSRILHRADLERIFADAGMAAPRNLPSEIRILRKARVLSPREVEEKASSAFSAHPPKGTRLVRVRPPSATTVPSGWDRVELRVPKLPRRTGDVSTTAMLAFQRGLETMMQLPVTLDLSLSEEAGRPDVARGNAVTIVIQRGLVEVSASAVAGADGDVGATIPLTIRTSGKVVRGRLVDKDHAVIVEGL